MLNRFKTGNFGVAVPTRGIGVPLDADSNTVGRMTYYGPTNFGPNIPEEQAARQQPPMPRYRDFVTTGGNQPPEVQQRVTGGIAGYLRRAFGRGS